MLSRILALLLLPTIAFAQATGPAFDACQPPGQWPRGTEDVDFFYSNQSVSDTPIKTGGGWDPAYRTPSNPAHQTNKTLLTDSVPTYTVGLLSPGSLTAWPYSFDVTNAILSDAPESDSRISQITLTDEGTVYLVKDYDFSGSLMRTQPGLTMVCYNCKFQDIRQDQTGGHDFFAIVDSLVDIPPDNPTALGPFRGGQTLDDCNTVVAYSEIAGGRDGGKAHGMTYYRNHIHGMMKPLPECVGGTNDGKVCSTNADCGGGGTCPDGVHADGIQINSSSVCSQAIENNIEMLFRQTNWPIFWQNSNSNGTDNMWAVNNLISGGQGSIGMCSKDPSNRFGPCGDIAVCGNATLAGNGNASWANPGADTSQNVTSFLSGTIQDMPGETNVRYFGPGNGFWGPSGFLTTITDNEGDSHTWPGSSKGDGEVPATGPHSQAAIETRVAQLETWVAEIRAAALGTTPVFSASVVCTQDSVGSQDATCSVSTLNGNAPLTYSKDCSGGTSWEPASNPFTCSGLTLDAAANIAVRVVDVGAQTAFTSDTVTMVDYQVVASLTSSIAEEPANSVQLTYTTNWTPSSCTFDLDGDSAYDDACSPGSGTCDLPDGTFTNEGSPYTIGVNCDGVTDAAQLTVTDAGTGPTITRIVLYGSTAEDELGSPVPEILVDPFEDGVETFSILNDAQLVYFGADLYGAGNVQPTASECVDWTLTTQDGTLNNVQGSVPHCFFFCQGQENLMPAGYFYTAGAASLAATWYDGPKVQGSCTGNAGPTTTINFTISDQDPSPSTDTILRGVTLQGVSIQ